jgi:PHD/YefM family antitoxin component YafN of YafNO toxin-antitoxin module
MSEQTVSPPAVQFIVDTEGRKTAVILPIKEYEEMLEDLHLGRVARESKNDPRRPFAEVVEEMRAADEIDV